MRRLLVLFALVVSSCRAKSHSSDAREPPDASAATAIAPPIVTSASKTTNAWDEGPVRTEDVPVPGDLPAIVVRGSHPHTRAMLFLAGMCVHPGGFVMAFQHSAAAHGDLVAVQGDVDCERGSGFR